MTAPKLVLHTSAYNAAPEPTAIIQALREIEFIGGGFDLDGQAHFYSGAAFLDGICFLGCAPSIQLDPPPPPADRYVDARAGRFCHIQLPTISATPQPRYTPDQGPRCRHCRTAISEVALRNTSATCPGCGLPVAPANLNWRQAGGCARLYLNIWGIHTAEAVPSDRLLDKLAQATGGPWQFFYIED